MLLNNSPVKMLHSPSVRFSTDHSIPTHAFHGTYLSVLTFHKQSVRFSHPTYGLHFTNSVFGHHLIEILAKQKGYLNTSPKVFAKRNDNIEHERGCSKPQTDDEVLPSVMVASGDIQSPEKPDMVVVASDPHLSLNLTQGILEDPINRVNLLDKLKAIHLHLLAMEQWNSSSLKLCHRTYLASATNLIHYLALKCLDVEQLKEDLSSVGLLSLESINANVLASITAGIQMLENLKACLLNSEDDEGDDNSTLSGSDCSKKTQFSMTTMRKKASSHRDSLLGTTIFRINCAHGDTSVWSNIIGSLKKNSQMLEKPCKILMDLAGPKLRTDPAKTGPCVMKISPKRDARGNIIFPAQVWLSHAESGAIPAHLNADALLSINDQEFLNNLEVGNILRFSDARGKRRMLKISQKIPIFAGIGCMAECLRTSYVESGTKFYLKGRKGKLSVGRVEGVPAVEHFIKLRVGDLLIISRDTCLTEQDTSVGSTDVAPRITCSSSLLFDSVKPGEPIAFDDGKIWGVIQGTSISEIIVSITHASLKGSKLGSGKSINIPESDIRFEGLTSKDLMDLDFVAAHANMVGISFIQDVHDVVILRNELEKRKLLNLGIVLKIETQSGFENLPLLLLQAMQSPNPLGVMIARGDLAVECGWERLADIQEEILSICGAAHVPVIWATQVLESLVKSGLPSRAEITDVATGRRASCIMLNKGKHISEAVSALDSILHCNSKKVKAKLKPLVMSSHLF
ncbi:plastidial pyruvate kinase 4, chloroplastic isoform X2 [Macadamia integrifolia]|uniref:plastidial pyruvate kinase 4, chloroplastic isoform X2 n=1 Tax=Macadamia integrifolia TaxID=60698 RepID=UPI001C4E88BA|nr:plastidial pyruvate kinase 4, chloroplastic isoform X2 [Macadamia integrifolia]